MEPMKKLILAGCLILACGHARGEDDTKEQKDKKDQKEEQKEQIHPTGLTVVVMDQANKVLDTVKIADDKKSYEITFQISEAMQKIKVVALGSRIDEDVPKGMFFTGMSKPLGGIGKVVVTIDVGKVISIEGNGFGTFALTDDISKSIINDLKEDKQADLTLIEELVDE